MGEKRFVSMDAVVALPWDLPVALHCKAWFYQGQAQWETCWGSKFTKGTLMFEAITKFVEAVFSTGVGAIGSVWNALKSLISG